ncbi:MAG TPA: asparagine synthase (glutamine-hydrolyzing) [Gemmatimonadota bacterium]|nr:asparagine synthase (glutamine-hydrolyzing) [Gemmatimonadota bacterium]
MCGICGEWNSRGARQDVLDLMSRRLVHRGPDDAGSIVLGETGLAVRRLRIIDLEGGHQPIPNEDESCWIVFNGEIYNYRELREDLARRGHRFRTHSDTEVILHLYEDAGSGVVDSLRGMFAFAIWDVRRRRLILARDRFGQKPLFYTFDGARLVFASEIKALLAGHGRDFPPDLEALDDYLALRFVPGPATMFEGIQKLPPAHVLELDASLARRDGVNVVQPRLDLRRYWTLRYAPVADIGEAEAVTEVRTRVRDAIQSHLVADVPVGAFLSGGMDSSVIVALMSEIGDGTPRTFSIGVAEQDFDELPFARAVATHCRTDHHEEVVSPDLVRLLPEMIYHLDEPSDPIAACMYHAAALAARHVKVVLTGDGGDEMFAGFDRYYGVRWAGAYARLPAAVRRALLGPLWYSLPDTAGYKTFAQKARWLHELSFHEDARRYAEATVFFRYGRPGRLGLYAPHLARRLAPRDPTRCIVDAFEQAEAETDLERMLFADVMTRLPEHSLMLTDRMTMARSLEARAPFLDHRLAEFVATLPAGLKLKGRRLKHLLREVARELLPETVLRRPKQGFMFPLGYWMKGPLLPVLEDLARESALVEDGLFATEPIRAMVGEHLADESDHHVRLWMLLNVELWYRMYVRGQSREDLSDRIADRMAETVGGRWAAGS